MGNIRGIKFFNRCNFFDRRGKAGGDDAVVNGLPDALQQLGLRHGLDVLLEEQNHVAKKKRMSAFPLLFDLGRVKRSRPPATSRIPSSTAAPPR